MELHCPRCGGILEKKNTYVYTLEKINEVSNWIYKLIIFLVFLLPYIRMPYMIFLDPGKLKCTHCGFWEDNIPSSYHKPGSVMVPNVQKESPKVNNVLAVIIITILSAICVLLIYLIYKL